MNENLMPEELASPSESDFTCSLVPLEEAPACISFVKALLDPTQLRAPILYTFDQLQVFLATGRMQLWLAKKRGVRGPCLFMITEIQEYPMGRMCHINLLGGKYFWPIARRFFPDFLNWCKMERIDFIETSTNPNIARFLKRLGFYMTGVRLHYALMPLH